MRKIIAVLTFLCFSSCCLLCVLFLNLIKSSDSPVYAKTPVVYAQNVSPHETSPPPDEGYVPIAGPNASAQTAPADGTFAAAPFELKTNDFSETNPDAFFETDADTLIFRVIAKNGEAFLFNDFWESYTFAQAQNADIHTQRDKAPLIGSAYSPPAAYIVENVPLIYQNPELPRGCEVTALCMLLNFCGVAVDKLALAQKIVKDETARETKNGVTHWGDPANGFIGNMYNMKKPGFGVYHGPVFDLAQTYAPNAVDVTGVSCADLKRFISRGMPVWIIINASYTRLPRRAFETWITPNGEIEITYKEHSALLTGYDEEFFYLNDPLSGKISVKSDGFADAWVQMGSQAIIIIPAAG